MKKLELKSPVVIAAIVVACVAVLIGGACAVASSGSDARNEPSPQEAAHVEQAALKTVEKGTVVARVDIDGWKNESATPVSVIVTAQEASATAESGGSEDASAKASASSGSLSSAKDTKDSKGGTFAFDANSDKRIELDVGAYSFEFSNVLLDDGTLYKAPATPESVTVKPGEEVRVNPKYTKVSADEVTEQDLTETVEQLAAVDAGAAEKAIANAGATAAGARDSWTPPPFIDKSVKPSGDAGSGSNDSGSNNGGSGSSGNGSHSGNNGGFSTPAPSPSRVWVDDYSDVWVVDSPAWDEEQFEDIYHWYCCQCGFEGTEDEVMAHCLADRKNHYSGNYWIESIVVGVAHHPETGHWEKQITGGHWE